MKKIAICDDEPAVRKQMEAYFKELESVFCISYFESGEALLESDVLYDVIFLDIDMKGISGIDTARKIRVRDKKAKIIYVTAYEDFRVYRNYSGGSACVRFRALAETKKGIGDFYE